MIQAAGAGGAGVVGANGASGGFSAAIDAVSGYTNGGSLTLSQTSVGGAGGGSDCFTGKPSNNVEFLNACTTADCGKFTTPLPLSKADGSLPPLP